MIQNNTFIEWVSSEFNDVEVEHGKRDLTYEDDLLRSHGQWDQCLGFNRLRSFIYDYLSEAEIFQPRVPSTDACTTNDIGCLQNLSFRAIAKCLIFLLITFG